MSSTGYPDDDATMRAVFAALDGGRASEPDGATPASGDSTPRSAAHLRVVSSVTEAPADAGAPDAGTTTADRAAGPGTHPVPKRPRIRAGEPGDRAPRPRKAAPPAMTATATQAATASGPAVQVPGDAGADQTTEALRAVLGAESAAAGETAAGRLRARLAGEWVRWHPLAPFLVATLAPVPFLVLAALAGGVFAFLALLWMTGVHFAIDEILKRRGVAGHAPLHAETADRLSLVLAGLHAGLLFLAVWALSGAAGLGPLAWLATFLAFGLWFGQVSNSNAHELIHRTDPWLFRTGMWVFVSLLFGHHTSAHRLVHHRFVATADDPSTAAAGEGFWAFALRAWPGAFIAGWEMEEHRRAKREAGGIRAVNPYTLYMAGAAGFLAVMLTLFGFDGLLAYVLLCVHAQLQLLLSDYVQHYGLLRGKLPSGALEPAGLEHSWDAPHPFSGLLMLNAPRHADHHAHPARPWPELRLSPGGRAPLLPYSLPVMATIALVPPAWHRVMDRRLAKLRKAA